MFIRFQTNIYNNTIYIYINKNKKQFMIFIFVLQIIYGY